MDQMGKSFVSTGMKRILARVLWMGCSLALLVRAANQVAPPDTPAGKMFSIWLEAFNSGDQKRMSDLVAKYYLPENANRLEGMIDFRDRTGGFNLISIEKSEPRRIEAIIREREGLSLIHI